MTGTIANLLLDLLIIGLLAATISYCWVLNRRIKILQDSKSELAQLLRHFDESTQRASESIIALQTASKKIGENIQFRIDKANYLLDDLSFMIEKGNKLSNQIEAGFAINRARSKVAEPMPEENGELPLPPVEKVAKPPEKRASSKEKTAATLEAVLERVMGRDKEEEDKSARKGRSKAEQDLLEMLKTGIKG